MEGTGLPQGTRVAVLGYGNQGRAHALNLRDSGVEVAVGARAGKGWEAAIADGFTPVSLAEAASLGRVVALCVPDETMREVWESGVREAVAPGSAVLFAHGFAVTFGEVGLPQGIPGLLVSPCGPGTAVRSGYLEGRGVPAFVAASQGGIELAKSYARAIGCGRLVETTFREETVCDLFGEQAVLCGGVPWLARAAWETLVGAGYSPEAAYLECVAQVRLLADLMAERGVAGMLAAVSDTAEFGAYEAGPEVAGPGLRAAFAARLARIESGEFARDWLAEARSGKRRLAALRAEAAAHPVESARPGA
jgi:ketol-acid reductoisomerase